jgi:hypothetical protein
MKISKFLFIALLVSLVRFLSIAGLNLVKADTCTGSHYWSYDRCESHYDPDIRHTVCNDLPNGGYTGDCFWISPGFCMNCGPVNAHCVDDGNGDFSCANDPAGGGCGGNSIPTFSGCNNCQTVDGGWSGWSTWSSCSSCSQSRRMTCTNPTPQCSDAGGCAAGAVQTETRSCGETPGGWSVWGTCNLGTCNQTRTCTDPSPACGGSNCIGPSSQHCGDVPGGWSAWPGCAIQCSQNETRVCNNPVPVCDGPQCLLLNGTRGLTENRTCGNSDQVTPLVPGNPRPNGIAEAPTIYTDTTSVTMSWDAVVSHASHYDVEVWDVDDMFNPVYENTNMAGSPVTQNFSYDHTYAWHVRAVNTVCAATGVSTTYYGEWTDFGYFHLNRSPTFTSLSIYSTDGNDTLITVETGDRNQTCQFEPNNPYDPYFTHVEGSSDGGQVGFRAQVGDLDGGDEIASVQLQFNNNQNYTFNNYPSPRTVSMGVGLTHDFTSGQVTTSAGLLRVMVTDIYGATTGWQSANRSLKVWDCNVPLSGTMYDSSSIGTASCSSSWDIYPPASLSMNFTQVSLTNPPFPLTNIPVNPPANYGPEDDHIYWGRQYLVSPNADLAASDPTRQWVDTGDGGSTRHCPGATARVDNNVVSPYSLVPSLRVNMAAIQNQDPWYQVTSGGIMSRTATVANMVPVTCQFDPSLVCQSAMSISGTSGTNGLVAASTITNASGCSFDLPDGICKAGMPNDWRYSGNIVNDTYSYQYFYDNYFVRQGLGVAIGTGTNMSNLLADPVGGTGVVMINGNLTVDTDNTVAPGRFLMVVVSGNINFLDTVNSSAGIFIAGGNITTSTATTNTPLQINGSLYTYGPASGISLNRGFSTGSQNNYLPGVKVVYRPDLLFSIPASLGKMITDWSITK